MNSIDIIEITEDKYHDPPSTTKSPPLISSFPVPFPSLLNSTLENIYISPFLIQTYF